MSYLFFREVISFSWGTRENVFLHFHLSFLVFGAFQPSIKYSYFEKGNVKKMRKKWTLFWSCVLVREWKVGKIFFSFFLPLKHHAADKQWKALTKWDPEFILDLKSSYHKVQFSSCSGAFNHIAFSLSEEGLAVRVKCWDSNLQLGWYIQSMFLVIWIGG